jgi:hypothetical protein
MVVEAATGVVATGNVVVRDPAAIMTEEGTVATAALPFASVTTAPPAGAGPVRVTVAVEDVPPVSEAGAIVNDDRTGGVIVRDAVLATPPKLAVMVAVFAAPTACVVMVNDAVVCPTATLTPEGTWALAESLERVTNSAAVAGAVDMVTCAVAVLPPIRLAGVTVRPISVFGGTAAYFVKNASVEPEITAWTAPFLGKLLELV